MNALLVLFLPALVAFAMVNWVYFKILKIAKDKNLVDNPDTRKLQKHPIPIMGGIAVFLGVVFGILSAYVFARLLPDVDFSASLLPILAAMMVMIYVGAIDDILGLSPCNRLMIEILTVLALIGSTGGCADDFHGLWGIGEISLWVAVPLTVLAGVGIINAINMIDGVNGLSSGLCIIYSILFGVIFVKSGDWTNAVLAFIMAAGLLPFYVHNVFGLRSRMFIGDAGTMTMGILLTWFLVSVLRKDGDIAQWGEDSGVGLVAMTLAFLSVPVADTLRVMTMRMIHGRSPFSPDKNHLHHVLIAAGISHFVTSSIIIFINLLITLIWLSTIVFGWEADAQLYVVIGASMLLVWGTFAFVRYNEIHNTDFMCRLSYYSARTHLGQTAWWKKITAWLDAPEGLGNETQIIPAMDTQKEREIPKETNNSVRKKHSENMENHKQADHMKIVAYLKGKDEVSVKDIIAHSNAEKLRVYPILFEIEEEGIITVLKRKSLGAPDIVTLK